MMEKYDRENREWHEKYLKFQNSIQKEKDENSKLL